MASIFLNNIASDNIITYDEYQLDLSITGRVEDILSGETLTLSLDGKQITTTVQPDLTFEFTINSDFIANDSELYLQELKDKTPYIITISYEDTSISKAIFIDLSTSVMSYNDFLDGTVDYDGLPQDGDVIDAQNVNNGPIQNRIDLIKLDSKIGDVDSIVDQKSGTFDSTIDNDLSNANATISNAISQLRVDVGNKNLLMTEKKYSLVSSINELFEKLYRPSQANDLVAKYDFQSNGNYILSGGTISYNGTLNESELPSSNILSQTMPYKTERYITNPSTTSTKYNNFSLSASKMMVQGYEVKIPKNINLYFQNTMEDNQPKHKIKYEDDIVASLVKTIPGFNYYRINYLDSYFTGIFEIVTLEGSRLFPDDFTFTTNGAVTQSLYLDIRNEMENNFGVSYTSVKIHSIPTILTVNSIEYECELDVNGLGIKWKNSVPPSGYSCTISNGSLVFIGKFEGGELLSTVSISDEKDLVIVSANAGFGDNCVVSFNRILPRYDRIYVDIIHTDYRANLWKSDITYDINDVVVYEGSTYKTSAVSLNEIPNVTSNWKNLGTVVEGNTLQPVFYYVEGYNNVQGQPVLPEISNGTSLPLCTILNIYGNTPTIKNEFSKAYKMTDIQNIESTLNDSVYNLARLQLTQNLTLADINTSKNLFVEPFFDNDLRDTELEIAHSVGAKPALINDGYLTSSITFSNLQYNLPSSLGHFIQLNSQEVATPIISQPNYSRSTLINKYQYAAPRKVNLSVTPQNFTWFDEQTINNYYDRVATLNGNAVDFNSVSNITAGRTSTSTGWVNTNFWQMTNTTTTTTTSVTEVATKRTDVLEEVIKEPRKVPTYNLRITAPDYSFNGAEQLRVQLGDLPEFFGLNSTLLKANANGGLDISFSIGGELKPLLSGERTLRVEGIGMPYQADAEKNVISGARGVAEVSQTPFLKIINNYDIITRNIIRTSTSRTDSMSTWWGGDGGDPLAQSFILPKTTYIDSIYVMVDAIDSSVEIDNCDLPKNTNNKILSNNSLPEDLEVYIYGTTVGYPDSSKILAKGIIPKGTIIQQINPDWTKISITPKVKFEKDVTYSFIVAGPYETSKILKQTGPTTWTVAIGEENTRLKLRNIKLGDSYPWPGARNLKYTEQKYIDGVMFSSSNANTWNAHQDSDLTFKISECKFLSAPRIVTFEENSTALTNITDVLFQSSSSNPELTYVDYLLKYSSTSGGALSNILSCNNGEHKILKTKIPAIYKTTIQATLGSKETPINGVVNDSPMLFREASIYFGTVNSESVYCTQNIDLSNGEIFATNKKLSLYIDTFNLSEANKNRLKIYYTTDVNIVEESWNEMFMDETYVGPSQERKFIVDALDSSIELSSYLRIKVVINTNLNNQSEIETRIGLKNLRIFAH